MDAFEFPDDSRQFCTSNLEGSNRGWEGNRG